MPAVLIVEVLQRSTMRKVIHGQGSQWIKHIRAIHRLRTHGRTRRGARATSTAIAGGYRAEANKVLAGFFRKRENFKTK